MKYLSLFSGYGGFELGIQQAYESIRSSDVPQERGKEKITEGIDEKKKGLHPISSETTISADNRDNELPNASIDQGQPHCIGFSEVDKYAIQTYLKHFKYEKCEKCRIENERKSEVPSLGDSQGQCSEQPDDGSKGLTCNCKHKNYGDITTINASKLPDFDLLCGGFPCQAFSIAGKRAGFEDTRGTLIYDVFRIIKEKHPKLVLLENVKGLLSHDSGRTFKTIVTSLAELGYAVEWQVLNAKNFGVPQNRERVFIVGHLGGFGGRQVFPIGRENETYIKEYPTICGSSQRHAAVNNGQVSCLSSAMGLGGGQIPMKFEGTKIRRLTPTECERLMGLPDGWTEGVSDTQRYKLCGNGVVVNVVEEIMKLLRM